MIMDDRLEQLQAEFQETSRRTAELKVELDLAQGKVPREGVPHYILIEEAAHEVGQMVSRMAQEIHMDQLAARQVSVARCPECGSRCELVPKKRGITSGDGPVALQELKGHCSVCRRDFFPDAGSLGL
jgi:uncharacterized protein with PIN domain